MGIRRETGKRIGRPEDIRLPRLPLNRSPALGLQQIIRILAFRQQRKPKRLSRLKLGKSPFDQAVSGAKPSFVAPGHTHTTVTDQITEIVLRKRTPLGWYIGLGVCFSLVMLLLDMVKRTFVLEPTSLVKACTLNGDD